MSPDRAAGDKIYEGSATAIAARDRCLGLASDTRPQNRLDVRLGELRVTRARSAGSVARVVSASVSLVLFMRSPSEIAWVVVQLVTVEVARDKPVGARARVDLETELMSEAQLSPLAIPDTEGSVAEAIFRRTNHQRLTPELRVNASSYGSVPRPNPPERPGVAIEVDGDCLLYTSDAADE